MRKVDALATLRLLADQCAKEEKEDKSFGLLNIEAYDRGKKQAYERAIDIVSNIE